MSLEKVSPRVLTLRGAIKAGLTFDGEGGGIHSEADTVFEKNLPETLTIDQAKELQDYVLDFADATSLAVGDAGIEYLQANKDIKSVSVKLKMGRDAVSTEFFREVDRRNPSTGETFKKYGVTTTKLSTGVGAGRGNYKKIQDDLSSRAASVFGQ